MLSAKFLRLEDPNFRKSEDADDFNSFIKTLNENQKEAFFTLVHKMDFYYYDVYSNNAIKMISFAVKIGAELNDITNEILL